MIKLKVGNRVDNGDYGYGTVAVVEERTSKNKNGSFIGVIYDEESVNGELHYLNGNSPECRGYWHYRRDLRYVSAGGAEPDCSAPPLLHTDLFNDSDYSTMPKSLLIAIILAREGGKTWPKSGWYENEAFFNVVN